jgi:two-component system, OmpR family, KDP operon response regulator KdpE
VTATARILVVDDEPSIVKAMAPLLRSRGYEVDVAATGRAALETFDRDPPSLVILDLMLPDLDGLEVCRQLRRRGETPIIILSAREAERDKVAALDLGADDYVTKPFGPDELLARVRVALRRTTGDPEPAGRLMRGDLVVDFDKRRVVRNGDEIRLTPKEFDLLVYLARNAGRVLTHRALLREIWGPHSVDQPEHLRVLVNAVRKKIEPDPANPRYILTEPWVGYRFAD